MSTFHWEGLRVRYNTRDGKPPTGFSYGDDSVTIADLLVIRGFTEEENARVIGCYFEQDKSLPRGMMVVEPKHVESESVTLPVDPPTEEPKP